MHRSGIAVPLLIVPGLGDSEAGHWQSRWERLFAARRVEQSDWLHPQLSAWAGTLRTAIQRSPGSLLVAHSLGSTLIAHAARQWPDLPVKGALLVAPADTEQSLAVPPDLSSFAGIPLQPLPFPSVMVVSSNDPFISPDRARIFASRWRSRLIDIGPRGHINVASGFGPWPDGERMLAAFADELTDTRITSARRH
jgi:predicted alpha/beta hydrolase family esterase